MTFRFFCPFLRSFPQRQCVRTISYFSFLCSPTFLKEIHGETLWNKETQFSLFLLCAMGTCSEKNPSWDKTRTRTNSRRRISLYSWNDDTLNLGQVWKENVVSSEAVLRLKKRANVADTIEYKSRRYKIYKQNIKPYQRFSYSRNGTTWTWALTGLKLNVQGKKCA